MPIISSPPGSQKVRKNSTGTEFSRRRLNLIEGSNVTLTVADDATDNEVDVTIAASAGAATTEAFVTIGNTAGLSAERALTGTSNQVTVTDNGANSTVVLSTPQDIATSSNVQFAFVGSGVAPSSTHQFEGYSTSNAPDGFSMTRSSDNGQGFPRYIMQRAMANDGQVTAADTLVGAFTARGKADSGGVYVDVVGLAYRVQGAVTSTSASGYMAFSTNDAGTGAVERVRIDKDGNLLINTLANVTTSEAAIVITTGTAPTANVSNSVSLYAVGANAELTVRDELGNITTLSPHRFELFQPNNQFSSPWSYYSKNPYIGKEINVDLYGAIKALEKVTNQQFIFERDLPDSEIRDWDKDQEEIRLKQEDDIKEQQKRKKDYDILKLEYDLLSEEEKTKASPPFWDEVIKKPYISKEPPDWMKKRLKIKKKAV